MIVAACDVCKVLNTEKPLLSMCFKGGYFLVAKTDETIVTAGSKSLCLDCLRVAVEEAFNDMTDSPWNESTEDK